MNHSTRPFGRRSRTRTGWLKAAFAGVVGVWTIDGFTNFVWRRQRKQVIEREIEARPSGATPAKRAAQRANENLRLDCSERELRLLGRAIHYALGVVPAILYGWARKPGFAPVRGALFGLASCVALDYVCGRVFGVCSPANHYPWQAHFRGIGGHAAYGLAVETTLGFLERAPRFTR